MSTARLVELRLTAFKSFRDQVLPLGDITVLTGRNSSGKSNALDALEVLSRLATGRDLADALDGRQSEAGPIRGGSRGCAPHGMSYFDLGCTVEVDTDLYRYDLRIQVDPELAIVDERLRGPRRDPLSKELGDGALLSTRSRAGYVAAEVDTGDGTTDLDVKNNRLALTQLLRSGPLAARSARRGSTAVLGALRGVFHLDPLPHLMRGFVPAGDSELRRTADNLSSAVDRLRRVNGAAFGRLTDLVREVADEHVNALTTVSSELGDVMLALREGPSRTDISPAREMSDGLLRFLAIATALLSVDRGLALDRDSDELDGTSVSVGVTLVIEEVENGLHPSQANRILRLLVEATRDVGVQILITTHSPALLNAMSGRLNRNVLVCYRDQHSGHSVVSPMTGLPGYERAMARGPIGDLVSEDRMVRPEPVTTDHDAFKRLLGTD